MSVPCIANYAIVVTMNTQVITLHLISRLLLVHMYAWVIRNIVRTWSMHACVCTGGQAQSVFLMLSQSASPCGLGHMTC